MLNGFTFTFEVFTQPLLSLKRFQLEMKSSQSLREDKREDE